MKYYLGKLPGNESRDLEYYLGMKQRREKAIFEANSFGLSFYPTLFIVCINILAAKISQLYFPSLFIK